MVLMKVPTFLRTEWLDAETMDKPLQAREPLCLSHAYILILALHPKTRSARSQCCQLLHPLSGDKDTGAGQAALQLHNRCASSVTI